LTTTAGSTTASRAASGGETTGLQGPLLPVWLV
jgi:hypothetical protein